MVSLRRLLKFVPGLLVALSASVAPQPCAAQPGDLVYLDEIRSSVKELYYSPTFDAAAWEGKVKEFGPKVREASRADVDGVFRDLLASLGSNHTYYVPAEVASSIGNGGMSYGGVGLTFIEDTDGTLHVADVFARGPASRSGIVAGDRITAVDSAKPTHMGIVGEPGTPLTLTIRSAEGTMRDVALGREKIFVYSDDLRWERRGRYGYISIDSFAESIPERFDLALARLGPIDGLVLDLRGNPGGLILSCAHVAARLGAPTIGKTVSKEKGKTTEERNGSSVSRQVKGPVVVLVDEDSGSSAEILAQTIKDQHLGRVLGQPTAAQVETGVEVPLSSGAQLMVTVGLTFSPSGFDFTKPVEPDEKLPPSDVGLRIREKKDSEVERALQVLDELVSALPTK